MIIKLDQSKKAALIKKSVIEALQKRIDEFAQTRNYTNAIFAASYATSATPKFSQEGQYIVEARDAMWLAGYAILAEVESGARPVPTVEEVIAEMPPLVWPN